TNILDCLGPIREGGFSLLEICSSPTHLDYHDSRTLEWTAQRMRSLGMEAYSFHAPFAEHIDITSYDPLQRRHSEEEVLRAAEAAARLGVRYFVIHPGPEQSRKPPPEQHLQHLRNAAEVLNRLARRCHELGVGFVLENMLPHLLFGHASDLLWLLGALGSRGVGICLDTGHAYLSSDLHTVMHKLSGHLKMVHANDNRGQYDDHLPPGLGNIDWNQVLSHLSQGDFRGALVLELKGDRPVEQVLEEARTARWHLRDLMRRLDFGQTLQPANASIPG
ncbi:MAG: sugar phosphate isomerase/epimerase, partial [Acidobacteria bacterium]|nr:sugar phosphate isomerase/epimerase [Acidobacteriota bacterium]